MFVKINGKISLQCQKVIGNENKCWVIAKLRDSNGMEYTINAPRGKIIGERFSTFLNKELDEYDIDLTEEDKKDIEGQIKGELSREPINLNEAQPLGILLKQLYEGAYGNEVWYENGLFVYDGYLYIKAMRNGELQKTLKDFGGEGWNATKFKKELKLMGLLKISKGQTFTYSVYSLGHSKIATGQAIKFLKIPVRSLEKACKSMGVKLSNKATDEEEIA